MSFFSKNDINELFTITVKREWQVLDQCVRRHENSVFRNICKILDKDSILQRLKDVSNEHVNPWELKIPIYGYDRSKKMEEGFRATLDDVINSQSVLYRLDEMFNGVSDGPPRFRVSTRTMQNGPVGWSEIMLNYFPHGVPVEIIRDDPEMPPLESGRTAPIPPSPIPMMDPQDNEYFGDCAASFADDDDRSVHQGGCACRQCRFRKE